MSTQIVTIAVTERQRQRLTELIRHVPDLGKSRISIVEDELSRAVWDALPVEEPS